MPKYLKNKRRRRHKFIKPTVETEIKMQSDSEESVRTKKTKTSSFKVLNGKKQAKQLRRMIFVVVILVITVTLFTVSLLSPTGLKELYGNFSATFSFKNQFPLELTGTETYSVASVNHYFYLLSDTDISVISNNGKTSFKDNHGFSNPVLCKSEARCLIYDQNGKGVKIYNAEESVLNLNMDFSVYSADIARDGTFAVATKSDKFTSKVTVFNKKGQFVFEWMCPEETVTSIAVAPNGKSVAVGTVKVSNGVFSSALYVLKYNSADPVFSKRYDGNFILGINSDSKKTFTVVFENKCDIISWKNYSTLQFESEYDVNFVHSNKSLTVIASSRENDDGNYKFSIYSDKQKLKKEFNFSGQVDDFCIKSNKIFILSGNNVYLINSDGNVAKKGDCGFGTVKIVPVSSDSCLAVGHNSITKIALQ